MGQSTEDLPAIGIGRSIKGVNRTINKRHRRLSQLARGIMMIEILLFLFLLERMMKMIEFHVDL